MPAMRAGNTITIPGRLTAGLNPADANSKAMSEAARLTVDHGFRYFMLAPGGPAGAQVLPGKSIVLKLYHKGEIRLTTPGLLDAEAILSPRAGVGARNPRQQP
jgi:hypothetical protein